MFLHYLENMNMFMMILGHMIAISTIMHVQFVVVLVDLKIL